MFYLAGKRPFGVSILYIGWDKHYGFQLYQSDPSGNYGGWKATCIGNNSAVSLWLIFFSHVFCSCMVLADGGLFQRKVLLHQALKTCLYGYLLFID